jgi:hypothetical protein
MTAVAEVSKTELAARESRALIMRMQAACQALPDGERMEESPPLKHWLTPGIYAREIHLKADTLVVGRVHRHEHLNIISKGSVSVFTEFEGDQIIHAPASFVSKPGTKRLVLTHEDAIWTTIHPNPDNVTDFATLEDMFTTEDYRELGMVVGNDQELIA